MSKGIKHIEPVESGSKSVTKIAPTNDIPTFEIEAEEMVHFEAIIEGAKNQVGMVADIKWVWAWYNNGSLDAWGNWSNKKAGQPPVEAQNINTNYAASLAPRVELVMILLAKRLGLKHLYMRQKGQGAKNKKGRC